MSRLTAAGAGSIFFLAIAGVGWMFQASPPLVWDFPAISGLRLAGGKIFTPEFMALTSGLILLYSRIHRRSRTRRDSIRLQRTDRSSTCPGIERLANTATDSLSSGPPRHHPPLTSQYLNLTKNSSLAIAVGYPDVFYVSSTIINQSGRAVEVISMVMLIYLTLSLLTSAFMNWYNKKSQLVER